MRFSFFVAPLSCGALVMSIFAAACSSGSSSSSASGLPAAFCAKVDACCTAAGLNNDDSECAANLPGVLPSGASGSSGADACAAAIEAESQAGFCVDYGSGLAACNGLVPQPFPVVTAGGCSLSTPCADPAAACVATYDKSEAGVCVVEQPGVAGSTPCIGTTTSTGSDATTIWIEQDELTPVSGFLCDVAAGLHCDSATVTCVPLGQGRCSSSAECAAADLCDVGDGTCVPRSAIGQDCSSDPTSCVPGASCVNKACVAMPGSPAAASPCVSGNSCGPASCTATDCAPAAPEMLSGICVLTLP